MLIQSLDSEFDEIDFLGGLEESCQLNPSARRMDKFKPMLGRSIFILERIDLDDVPVFRREIDRDDASVDDSVLELESYVRMDIECEIQDTAAYRHLFDVSLRRIQENILVQ